MLFNSLDYLVFFPLVVLGFFLLPGRLRWLFLLGASYYFYMSWKASYAVLILITTASTFYLARSMGSGPPRARRRLLILGLGLNFGILLAFKYGNFLGANLNALFGLVSLPWSVPAYDLVLPVGISFYTFQAIGYLLDVYHGREEAEPSLGRYALYVSFFPQLVAGPIERAGRLIPQLGGAARFDYMRLVGGLKLIAWGLFKKLVIADRLAALVNPVYADPGGWDAATLLLATYAFTFQIYCDFSGYSDIAIGSARVMGIDLMTNFARPYGAPSVREFWRRWHISLSTWFRDYMYVPLGGNRVKAGRMYLNLMAVFLVCGLWHGAAWTFVLWGGLHGLLLVGSHAGRPLRQRLAALTGLDRVPALRRVVRVLITFNLVALLWVFFRASSLGDALYILGSIFSPAAWGAAGPPAVISGYQLSLALYAVLFMLGVEWLQRDRAYRRFLAHSPLWVRFPVYLLTVLSIVIFGEFSTMEFIYFQF